MCDRWSYSDKKRYEVLGVVRDALDRGDAIGISCDDVHRYQFEPAKPPTTLKPPTINAQQKKELMKVIMHAMFCRKRQGTCLIKSCSKAKAYLLKLEAHSRTCTRTSTYPGPEGRATA